MPCHALGPHFYEQRSSVCARVTPAHTELLELAAPSRGRPSILLCILALSRPLLVSRAASGELGPTKRSLRWLSSVLLSALDYVESY